MWRDGRTLADVLTEKAVENAMLVHAAFGGSTNLLIHIPAIAHSAGLPRPTVDDWRRVNASVPRLVDALPNGPRHHPTVRVFLAGGVPEVMLHLRELGLLHGEARTVLGRTWDDVLDEWERSERRARLRERLTEADGVDPADVISSPARAREKGMTSTVCFPGGNLAPGGSVIKATAIDPRVLDEDGVYRLTGRARVFTSEPDAIAAIKGTGESEPIQAGDVIVLAGRGPLGTGMEETYQLTSALKFLPFGREVAMVTDARFSGVSTGACIGHVSPEALEGGPIGRLLDGDLVRLVVDPQSSRRPSTSSATARKSGGPRRRRVCLRNAPCATMSHRTRGCRRTRVLWARLQSASGGLWGGCVYDAEAIAAALDRAPAAPVSV